MKSAIIKINYNLRCPVTINITNDLGKNKNSVLFVKALEDEKEKLMKVFNLDNDDYNDLAAIAYAIMGQESNFGSSMRLWLKEKNQSSVILAKALRSVWNGKNPFVASTLSTSRGFTQIKELPEGEWRKEYPSINKDTLLDPKKSAVATMAYLVEAVHILKKIAADNAQDPRKIKITKENLEDYIAYIYRGKKSSLKSTDVQVDVDFNTYVQGLRKNMSYIEIAQKIN